jgi:glycosyltransferase involved in cell wall biosynthesis
MTRSGARSSTRRRVLVVTTWYPDAETPFRTPFCLAHVHAIKKSGAEVHVMHVDLRPREARARSEIYSGVRTTRLPLKPTNLFAWLRIAQALRRELRRADVLHTMAFSSVLIALAPWLTRRIPWVHTEHWNGVVNPSSGPYWWRRLAALRYALKFPHAVTAVTDQLQEAMAPFCRIDAVTTVPCVVHPQDVVELPAKPPVQLVAVGLLNDRKDPITAVSTVAWLLAEGHDVHLTWVGDGPLRESTEQHARDLGVADRIHLVGPVPPIQIPSLLAKAHLFFVPTRQENFFTAAAEALASGRMVVLPRSGGFTEYCNADNSVLVDTRRPEDLGRAVMAAAGLLHRRDPRQVAATVKDQFSEAIVGSTFVRIYDEIAPSHL